MKLKSCKVCKEKFTPIRPLQAVCSLKCSYEHALQLKIKKDKAETKKLKETLLTHSDYLKMAQTVFNAYIRKRDKNLPCVSCGTNKQYVQYHCGHYKSVGAYPELRYNELNCHKQCATCNNIKSGNIIEYRKGLIRRIGIDNLNWLESEHPPVKYSITELKDFITLYKKKIKEFN